MDFALSPVEEQANERWKQISLIALGTLAVIGGIALLSTMVILGLGGESAMNWSFGAVGGYILGALLATGALSTTGMLLLVRAAEIPDLPPYKGYEPLSDGDKEAGVNSSP
jgi:hypothetical protein